MQGIAQHEVKDVGDRNSCRGIIRRSAAKRSNAAPYSKKTLQSNAGAGLMLTEDERTRFCDGWTSSDWAVLVHRGITVDGGSDSSRRISIRARWSGSPSNQPEGLVPGSSMLTIAGANQPRGILVRRETQVSLQHHCEKLRGCRQLALALVPPDAGISEFKKVVGPVADLEVKRVNSGLEFLLRDPLKLSELPPEIEGALR